MSGHKLHNLLMAERELKLDFSPPALSLDTWMLGPGDSVAGHPVIVQCLVCIGSSGTCFQILTNRFRWAFLLRSLDCYICKGFLSFFKFFSLKKIGSGGGSG